jgi:uncharacterized protein (DUF433 family)
MSTKRWLIVLVAVVAIVGVSAFAVLGQDDGDNAPPFGPRGYGMGMMGGHMMWDADESPMFTAVAEALGIDVQTLFTELQSGKTIAELAEEHGVELNAISDAWLATITTHLDAMVEAGILTQEQADARLEFMRQNFETMPMFNGTFPIFRGMMGGYGWGMMGGMWGHHGWGPQGGMMGRGPNF